LDRRAVVAWAGVLAAALAGAGGFAAYELWRPRQAPGYGPDPDLMAGKTPWPRTLTVDEQRVTAALVDFILPAEGKAPAASEVGVHELIDEWVSAPYPEQVADRELILGGLAWINRAATRSGGQPFADAKPQIREAVLARLAANTGSGEAPPVGFYARLRRLTIGGYYTTKAGFEDIGYIGNKALDAFPAPSAAVRAALDRAYRTQGLPSRNAPWT